MTAFKTNFAAFRKFWPAYGQAVLHCETDKAEGGYIRQEGDYIKRFRSLIHCRKRHKKQAEHVGNLCGDNEFVG